MWEAFLLGGLQGATEFLPVSSSGHLVMGQAVLGIAVPGVVFEVMLHVATLVSVLVVYRGRLGKLVRGTLRRDVEAWRYLGLLALATVPAGAAGILLGDAVESLFDIPGVTGVALLVTGTFLWTARAAQHRWAARDAERAPRDGEGALQPEERSSRRLPATGPAPDMLAALVMGVAQAFALVPGISRSGATVVAGLWMGVDPGEAAAFSFLMAVPAIAGAAVLEWPELAATTGGGIGPGPLAWGFVVAALTGILAIRIFVTMLHRRSFHRFGPYCWTVGLGFLLYLALR